MYLGGGGDPGLHPGMSVLLVKLMSQARNHTLVFASVILRWVLTAALECPLLHNVSNAG